MKVIILSGGFGTRISEYTSIIPKPMIRVGGKPIIEHIMEIYSKHGYEDFYLALGYKAEIIKEYFYKYEFLNSDFKYVRIFSSKAHTINPEVTLSSL